MFLQKQRSAGATTGVAGLLVLRLGHREVMGKKMPHTLVQAISGGHNGEI